MDVKEDYHFLSVPYVIDRKLYKYYSNTEFAIDCIRNRRVHLDDPRAFNDPFDAVFHCEKISTLTSFDSDKVLSEKILEYLYTVKNDERSIHYQEIINSYIEFLEKKSGMLSNVSTERPVKDVLKRMYSMLGSVNFSLEEFVSTIDCGFVERERVMRVKCRISCFSEVSDSILMWSYYAKGHDGICIEFDLSLLKKNTELTNKIFRGMTKVHYSPVRADLQYSSSSTSDLNFLVTKANVWEHEHEWRLISTTDAEYLPFDCISNVYIGINFDVKATKYKRLLKAVDSHNSLAIRQCKLSLDRYQIESEEIYNSYLNTLIKRKEKDQSVQIA